MGFGFTGRSRTKASKARRRCGLDCNAKTDKIDRETMVRVLLADKRGASRVCAMVKVPTPGEEDRHLCGERNALTAERVRHVNRVKRLLVSQGVSGYQPLRGDRRQRLEELQTSDGRAFPQHLKALINRSSIGLNSFSNRSRPWRPRGTRYWLWDKRPCRRRQRCYLT